MTAAMIVPQPREKVEPEKRKPLTRREVIELAVRQGGKCGCGCGVKLDALREGVVDEHLIPLEIRENANALDNRALFRKPCADAKTKADRKAIAKVKRLAGETCTGPRRPIRSRGFDKTRSRKFDGTVVARKPAGGGAANPLASGKAKPTEKQNPQGATNG